MRSEHCDYDKAKGALKVFKIIGFIILGAAACFLFGLVIMWLWNWLMPMIFNLPVLNYWQSVGILALASILFGRLGGRSGGDKSEKKKSRPIRDSIKEEIKKEFEKEFEKEYGKHKDNKDNEGYDEMYEEWWGQEGERLFEEYMAAKKE